MSAEPALLADGEVVLAGKAPTVYLLNGAHLGGIGGQQASLTGACAGDIDGGVAACPATRCYLPCLSAGRSRSGSPVPARAAPAVELRERGGPPIVAGGLVWTIGQDGILYGLDPATGKVRQQAAIGGVANHFPTPSVGDGLLLAASASGWSRSARARPAPAAAARAGAPRLARPVPGPSPTPAVPRPAGHEPQGPAGYPPAAIGGIAGGRIDPARRRRLADSRRRRPGSSEPPA